VISTSSPIDAFIAFFRPEVRVLFNWSRFEAEKWPLVLIVADQLRDIENWHMPWNVDRDGKETHYSEASARPIQVGEVPTLINKFSRQRRISIREIHQTPSPKCICIPTYALPGGKQFILDGNHRIASLALAMDPFRILAFSIQGPMDHRILPELKYWE
jgi:hypothetical protein